MTQDVPYDVADIRQYTLGLLKETCPDMDPKQMSMTADRLIGRAGAEFERRMMIRERKAKERNLDPRYVVSKEAYEAFCKVKLPVKRVRNAFNLVDSNIKLQSNLGDVDIHERIAHPRLSPTYNEPKRAALPHYSPDGSSREASNLSSGISNIQSDRGSPIMLNSENDEALTVSGWYSENSHDGFPPNGHKFNGFNDKFNGSRCYSSGEGKIYPQTNIDEYPVNGTNGFRKFRREGRNNVRFGKRGRPNHLNNNIPSGGNGFQNTPFQPNVPIPKRKRFN